MTYLYIVLVSLTIINTNNINIMKKPNDVAIPDKKVEDKKQQKNLRISGSLAIKDENKDNLNGMLGKVSI